MAIPVLSGHRVTAAAFVERLTRPAALLAIIAWTVVVSAVLVLFVDREVVTYFRDDASPSVRSTFHMLTDMAKGHWPIGTSLIALIILAWFQRRCDVPDWYAVLAKSRRKWAYVFWTSVISGIAVNVLKWPIGRLRPRYFFQDGSYGFIPFNMDFGALALPSGHTTTAIAVAVAAAIAWPRYAVPLLIIGLTFGISRIVVGAHFPADVIAGMCVGSLSALLLAKHFFPDAVGSGLGGTGA